MTLYCLSNQNAQLNTQSHSDWYAIVTQDDGSSGAGVVASILLATLMALIN